MSIHRSCLCLAASLLTILLVNGLPSHVELEAKNVLVDADQLVTMAAYMKQIILRNVEGCDELHEFLMNSHESLDWISDKMAWTLLRLAISLDDTFTEDFLALLLNQ